MLAAACTRMYSPCWIGVSVPVDPATGCAHYTIQGASRATGMLSESQMHANQPLTISSSAIFRRLIGLGSWLSASVLVRVSARGSIGGDRPNVTGDGKSTGPRCRGTGSRGPVWEDERWCGVEWEKTEFVGLWRKLGERGSRTASSRPDVQVAGYGSLRRCAW
jgi:hypothetical protein